MEWQIAEQQGQWHILEKNIFEVSACQEFHTRISDAGGTATVVIYDRLRPVQAYVTCEASPKSYVDIFAIGKEIFIEKPDLLQHATPIKGGTGTGGENLSRLFESSGDRLFVPTSKRTSIGRVTVSRRI